MLQREYTVRVYFVGSIFCSSSIILLLYLFINGIGSVRVLLLKEDYAFLSLVHLI